MFKKKLKQAAENKCQEKSRQHPLTLESLTSTLSKIDEAEIIERSNSLKQKLIFIYIKTLINQERLNESVITPFQNCKEKQIIDCISNAKIIKITSLEEANDKLVEGFVLINNLSQDLWLGVELANPLSRSIEPSQTETIIFGAKDSFTEKLEDNIAMIRRRLPLTSLKTVKFTLGTLSKTTVMMMYIEGLTNPEFINLTKEKLSNIDYDQFLDSSQIAAFIEEHPNSLFPQFLETDRPDSCAYSLGIGKIILLVNNTPFALIAPITFFHLFQSPEDYFTLWPIASFLRCIRYLSFFLSICLIPLYVSLATLHYQMIPLQILFVLLESRSKLPFTPFWEAFLMLLVLEIIKEASLRMPTKTGQTLGVIGGIVIGQASVQAGFVSQILIVLVGISTIASFLVPNYLVTKSTTYIQFFFLIIANFLGVYGIAIGLIILLIHLNGLTSLKQPYFAPVAPFYWKDWNDLFIRGPLPLMKTRPDYLHPLQKWRIRKKR